MIRGLTFACAVLSVCGLALTAQAQMESPYQAHMAARLMQQPGNIDLATAIQTAERQTNGEAIRADAFVPPLWQASGMEQLKFAITCVTNNNQLQTVFIDGHTGGVETVQPGMTGWMGTSRFQQMGYGQAPYGQQYSPWQQQPAFGGWRSQNWQQGQPAWQWSWQRGYGEENQPGWWQSGQGWPSGWTPYYGGEQFYQYRSPQQRYWGPQQQWGDWQQFEPEEGYEAQGYPEGESFYGTPPQGWAGQYGQPMGGMPMMAAQPELASKIIGDTVKNEQNQDIGRIDDLAVNTFTGRVPFVVLDSNNKLYPIPFRLIRPVGNNQVALNIPQGRLQNLPTLDRANWPQSVNERLVSIVHQVLGLRPEFGYAGFRAEGGFPPGAPQTQPSGPGVMPGQMGQPGALPIRKATDLMNQAVHNPQGETLGTIKDLLIDPYRARLAYVIVSFHNMGDKLVAVPWDAFNVQQGHIVLYADPNRLQQAQSMSFSPDNWPDMSNPEWVQREAQIWGTPPYPLMGHGRMMGGMRPERMHGGPQQHMQPGQPPTPPPGQGVGQMPGGRNTP
jgi:sporulation protein YlmC with PRC-barrel domain